MADRQTTQLVELEIVRGQAHERRRPVAGPAFLVGSSCECDLVLGAADFAEVYACLFVGANGVTVRQVGDGPVLFVNGWPATEATLTAGDQLVAGPFEFLVHVTRPADTLAMSDEPISSSFANRWACPHQIGDAVALRAASKLIDDIRAALEAERRAVRRPA